MRKATILVLFIIVFLVAGCGNNVSKKAADTTIKQKSKVERDIPASVEEEVKNMAPPPLPGPPPPLPDEE